MLYMRRCSVSRQRQGRRIGNSSKIRYTLTVRFCFLDWDFNPSDVKCDDYSCGCIVACVIACSLIRSLTQSFTSSTGAMSSHGSRNASVVSNNGQRQNTKDEYLMVPGQTTTRYATHSLNEGVTCKGYLCGDKRRRVTCYFVSFAIFLILWVVLCVWFVWVCECIQVSEWVSEWVCVLLWVCLYVHVCEHLLTT
jgi:hypothetical protein